MSANNEKFKNEYIKSLAIKGGWVTTYFNIEKSIFMFYHPEFRCHIDVWSRSMKVITCMKHPIGYTILLREGLGLNDIKNIFANPRVYSGKGRRLD